MVIKYKFLTVKSVTLMLIISLLSAGLGMWLHINNLLNQKINFAQNSNIIVPAGATVSSMLNSLEQQNMIKGSKILGLYFKTQKKIVIKRGNYQPQPNITLSELVNLWHKGQIAQYSVTLVEGSNIHQLRQVLAKQSNLIQKLPNITDAELMQALGRSGHPEGRFFPDTYNFTNTMADLDILKLAADKLDKVLEQEWQKRAPNLPYKDKYQALIMASIIEKETANVHEYAEIAGVFVRRLSKNMRLQTDPTVIYGMGANYKGKIKRSDLRKPTAYNTYVIDGLPPTPIAAAGQNAIYAALHPADGNSLYFVAKGDGSHEFSSNLDEHNKAVRKYQLKRRADYRSTPKPAVSSQTSGNLPPNQK